MRNIKFRAFVLGKMYDVKELVFSEDGLTIVTDGGFHTITNGTNKDENAHLMMSTGLKDNNGVEIYEGDIVKCVAREEYKEENVTTDVIFGNDLQWQVRSMGVGSKYEHGLPLIWGGWQSIEVIGNIHEEEK